MSDDSKIWCDDLIKDLVVNIQAEEHYVVPVIGDDAFFVEGSDKSLQHYILDAVLKKNQLDEIYDASEFQEGIKGYTRLFSRLKKEQNSNLKKYIIQELNCEETTSRVHLRSEVKNFLDSGNFPLIISTSIYDILDRELNDNYDVVSYYKGPYTSQDIVLVHEDTIFSKTIFNIFGKLGTNKDCVFTDNDFLSYLHSLHDTKLAPANIKKYLSSRHLIMLGCNIPDWTFRFLLYSLKAKDGKLKPDEDNLGNNSFVGGNVSPNKDGDLDYFLSEISYLSGHELSKTLKKINSNIQPISKPKLFLSCSSIDYRSTNIIELKIKLSERFEVWFCPEKIKEKGGEKYWQKIREGLQESEYFMPVITESLLIKLLKMEAILSVDPQPDTPNEMGIITEWKYALQYKCLNNTCPYILCDFSDFKEVQDNKMKLLKKIFFNDDGAQALTIPINKFNPHTDI